MGMFNPDKDEERFFGQLYLKCRAKESAKPYYLEEDTRPDLTPIIEGETYIVPGRDYAFEVTAYLPLGVTDFATSMPGGRVNLRGVTGSLESTYCGGDWFRENAKLAKLGR